MEEKKLTDEAVNATVKSLKWVCNQIPNDLGDSNEERMLKCIRLYCEQGIAAINLQKTKIEQLEAAVKLHVMDIDYLHAEREKRVAEVYPEFMSDYSIMREELNESNERLVELNRENEQLVKEKKLIKDMNAELQEQATKNYNNGFDRGVKAAVEKMRAYLPPRDVDDYPDAIPSHWQLDEVLRQLIGNK